MIRSMSFMRRLLSRNSARLPSIKSFPNVADRKSFKYLMVGLGATLVQSLVGCRLRYVCVDEFEEKTRALRSLASNKAVVGDDVSSLAKFQAAMFSTAIAVPAKATELYLNLRRSIEKCVQEFTEPLSGKLLPNRHPKEQHTFTLVLDLNETLVCSDWELARGGRTYKRPGAYAFLKHLTKYYEIVVYSDQRQLFVDTVTKSLDPKHYIRYKLNRGATKYQNGTRYRDVATHKPPDIRPVLASYRGGGLGKEFLKHSVEHQKEANARTEGSMDELDRVEN